MAVTNVTQKSKLFQTFAGVIKTAQLSFILCFGRRMSSVSVNANRNRRREMMSAFG